MSFGRRCRRLVWLLGLLGLLGWAPIMVSAQPAAETVDLAAYEARIAAALQQLESGGETALPAVRARLAAIASVQLPSGEMIEPSPLLPDELDLTAALGRLRLVQEQLKGARGDDATARLRRLEGVLARPEFNEIMRGPTIWERLWRWLRDLLPAPASDGQAAVAQTLNDRLVWLVIAAVGGVLLVLLLSYWLQRLLRGFVANAEAERAASDMEEIPATAAIARQQAGELARVGNYRLAVRQLYLSALLHLEERNLLRYDRSLTNREYLAQLEGTEAVQRHLRPVVQTFDDVWYGVREPDQATFAEYEREISRLREVQS